MKDAFAYALRISSTTDNRLVPQPEAEEILDCTPGLLSALRESGRVIFAKAGRNFFYLKSSLDKYLAEEKEGSYVS